MNPLEIDEDVYTSVTNDKSIDINFTLKGEQFQHVKFTVLPTFFETFFNEKVENIKLLANKMFKTKVLCTNNEQDNYVINIENTLETTRRYSCTIHCSCALIGKGGFPIQQVC